VPMLAELVDAVVGIDTHRDTHEAEIAHPTGMPIATCQVSNDSTGYAELLAWIVDHAPGPRLVVSIEGTRSYGLPLARAVSAAGLLVVECEQPNRHSRRPGPPPRPTRCQPRARRAASRDPTDRPGRARRPARAHG
jgi:transposase